MDSEAVLYQILAHHLPYHMNRRVTLRSWEFLQETLPVATILSGGNSTEQKNLRNVDRVGISALCNTDAASWLSSELVTAHSC
jgi:hypothetical protein